MDGDLIKSLLKGSVATNCGPTAKEFFLAQAEDDYNNGNELQSIFYQVRTLFQAFQDRYYQLESAERANYAGGGGGGMLAQRLFDGMNDWEKVDFKSNPLMQHVFHKLTQAPQADPQSNAQGKMHRNDGYISCNFLQNITDPLEGMRKIEEICQELPKEWTILQLCKGPRTETTYSTFPQIHQRDAAIYVTLLRHARSRDYPTPICLRFSKYEQEELFNKFAGIANRFKQCIHVNPKEYTMKEAKQEYWSILDDLNRHISVTLSELQRFFYPWKFLFTGKPFTSTASSSSYQSRAFTSVDDLCNEHSWKPNERVLLSLAALHIVALSELDVHDICRLLTDVECQQIAAIKLLMKLKSIANQGRSNANAADCVSKHYPCILVVDESLDHFFWEELNVQQEFCRVNSLQCLYRLYQQYKQRIHNGYLNVNITEGGCVVNPDNNLPKTELRMRCFFQYWTPHWLLKFGEKPTHDDLVNVFFKRSCYVYAGHGSGLQYINGKHIARQRINGVVFLFGCDSSRLHSNGLYSELVGPHLYYHAAMCPTLVGTLMPALDANMDSVAAEILSRWIAPNSRHVLPWNEIDRSAWVKEGVIKSMCSDRGNGPTIATTPHYQMGSLCGILARVHQRISEPKFYNTVPYVCRGLPAWNCHVQALP